LSGDHLAEQAIHNVDALNWAFNGHPDKAIGTGGRLVRTSPEFGHIYDHFTIVYEYPNETFATMMCRQQDGTDKKVANEFTGTKGTAYVLPDYYITGANEWEYDVDEPNNMYVQEHADLIASIRAGKPLNELKSVTESSLTAVMGRMSAYTGKTITWEEALNAPEDLMPEDLSWGPMPMPPVALPGHMTD
jgi:myo-inositol 2-dehydrogenase/D-chiro-inositol 1-dehydrogenase